MVMWLACLALQIFAIHHCKSCNFCIYVGHIVLLYTTMICCFHTILCSTTWGYQLCSLEIRPLKFLLDSQNLLCFHVVNNIPFKRIGFKPRISKRLAAQLGPNDWISGYCKFKTVMHLRHIDIKSLWRMKLN